MKKKISFISTYSDRANATQTFVYMNIKQTLDYIRTFNILKGQTTRFQKVMNNCNQSRNDSFKMLKKLILYFLLRMTVIMFKNKKMYFKRINDKEREKRVNWQFQRVIARGHLRVENSREMKQTVYKYLKILGEIT